MLQPSSVMLSAKSTTKLKICTFFNRAYLHIAILPLFAACATNYVDIPTWDNLEPASIDIQRPVGLPDRPSPVRSNDTEVVFDLNGMRQLQDLRISAETNFAIALANAEALEDQSKAYNMLIEAGKLQRQFTQIRQEQLEREKRAHEQDNWFYRGVIALMLVVGITL